ncbi:MAG TPA: HEAT repeat domain-containing protein [Planctomycetota bacterium]
MGTTMLKRTFTATLMLAAAAFAQDERKQLARLLGEDPFAKLAAIGSSDRDEAREKAWTLREKLDPRVLVRLLRAGLGSEDERVIFGASMLLGDLSLPALELRHAAARVIPRLGDQDCPVTVEELETLWGSRDVPTVLARIPALDEPEANYCLGELHRVVRAEHVPAHCDLALAAKGDVRWFALDNATLTAGFSGEHGPLAIATWAKCSGVPFDTAADGERLPGALRAALAWILDNPPPTAKEGTVADKTVRPRHVLVARWLMASRPGAQDLPLLRRLIGNRAFRPEALAALGHLRDPGSLTLLREHAASANLDTQRSACMGLARRGEAKALDALLAGPDDFLACGLAVASAERRRDFAAQVIAMPAADAVAALRRIEGARTEIFPPRVPSVDDAWLADFEPLAAAAKNLDAPVLRTLIAVIPACATASLADRLLAHEAAVLFAGSADPEQPWTGPRGDLGFRGVWAFLEVTRPELFLTRLREGLASADEAVQRTCADLLLRLCDRDSVGPLLAWAKRTEADRWFELAALGGDDVRAALLARAAEDGDALRALAHLHGMPAVVTQSWEIPDDAVVAVVDALRRGDAAAAFLASRAGRPRDETDLEEVARLQTWRSEAVEAFVLRSTQRSGPDALAELRWQLDSGLHREDATIRRTLRELSLDGRYVTHQFYARHLPAGRDLTLLSFWIDELGANCCRRVVADQALTAMFGEEPEHGDDDNEAVTLRLRRRLLPVQDRLRWSTLANGYVVAGR